MKKLLSFTVIISFILIGLGSCAKYDDGPSLSLRSKTTRIVGTWDFINATSNGVDVSNNYSTDFQYIINETLAATMVFNGVEIPGTWAFSDDKSLFIFTDDLTNTSKEYTIKRLTYDEFWFEDNDGSKVTLLKFGKL